jgi:hypothetical protein
MQTITTGAARANGALRLPADVAAYLKRHGLELGDILTDSNPKLNKGAAIARAVIHHTLPGRALGRGDQFRQRGDRATARLSANLGRPMRGAWPDG